MTELVGTVRQMKPQTGARRPTCRVGPRHSGGRVGCAFKGTQAFSRVLSDGPIQEEVGAVPFVTDFGGASGSGAPVDVEMQVVYGLQTIAAPATYQVIIESFDDVWEGPVGLLTGCLRVTAADRWALHWG